MVWGVLLSKLMCMFSVYQCIFGMKVIILVEIIFSLSIDFLLVRKFRFLIRINGTLLDYKKFGAWEFYKFGDESGG